LDAQRASPARRRLRAIEGQVRGLVPMIDEDRPCLDMLVQIAAAQEALSQVNKLVMRTFLEN
ncbi:MAG TPA: metal-sensitive transcriptional regulator, partial [Chloroflexia bacterium]